MAFLRRKGNTFYLVHNVREGDRVKQLHLAKLGSVPALPMTWFDKLPAPIPSWTSIGTNCASRSTIA